MSKLDASLLTDVRGLFDVHSAVAVLKAIHRSNSPTYAVREAGKNKQQRIDRLALLLFARVLVALLLPILPPVLLLSVIFEDFPSPHPPPTTPILGMVVGTVPGIGVSFSRCCFFVQFFEFKWLEE